MQYINHNFAANFNAYKKYDETGLLNDMVMDDVAKLVVFDKEGLLYAIAESGYGISRKPTNKDILLMLKKNIATDKRLTENIAKLIISNNSGQKSKGSKLATNDRYNYKSSKNQTEQKQTSLNSLKSEVASSFLNMDGALDNKLEQHTKNKLQMEGDIVSNKDLKTAIKKAYAKSFVVTTLFIVGGYFLLKKVAKMPMFANGGAIAEEPIAAPMPVEPIATQQPVAPPPIEAPQAGFDAHGMKIE